MVSLGSLSAAEVNRVAAAALGAAPTPDLLRTLMVSTAACRSSCIRRSPRRRTRRRSTRDGDRAAAKFALIERLRRVDEPVLDTLLVSSLSPDLVPTTWRRVVLSSRHRSWWTAPVPAD